MHYGILTAIGNTPLVRVERVIPGAGFRLFAKLEALNPGGSSKDRPAVGILRHAWENGTIGADTVVVESSSGNMGIGLAQACSIFGLRFICVVDPKTTRQNLRTLEAYGAEVDLVEVPDPVSGDFLQARIQRVKSLLSLIPGSFWTNQYDNEMNSLSHYATTMHEIASALDGKVDFLFCATSTCGTVRGCSEYVRDHDMRTHVVAVDAVGSLIFAEEPGRRLIPGIGASLRPGLLRPGLVQRCVHVTDLECVTGCRRLVRYEGILAGGSSGGVLTAVDKLKHEIPPDATCVMVLADRGDRYLDTIYSDRWVREHLGEVGILRSERSPVLRRSEVLNARLAPAQPVLVGAS